MNRDELLDLCEAFVRRRSGATLDDGVTTMPPVIQIVDSYLHAEISESEKNSLLAFVRGPEHEPEDEVGFDLEEPVFAELDEPDGP